MNIYQQNSYAHSIGWSQWHFEWCTKYRYEIFRSTYIKNLCLIAIQEAAKKHNIEIIELEVDSNHVHTVVSLPLTMPPVKALNLMKGLSACLLFKLVPNLRKRYKKGHLWSPGKFAASVGHITLETAKKYLEEHHAKSVTINRNPRHEAKRNGRPRRVEPLGRGGCQLFVLLVYLFIQIIQEN